MLPLIHQHIVDRCLSPRAIQWTIKKCKTLGQFCESLYLQGSVLWSCMVAGRRWGFLPVLFSRWWGRGIFPGMCWCGHHEMSCITLNSEAMGCRLTSRQRTKCDAGWRGKAGVVTAAGINGNGGWDHTPHVALLYPHEGAHSNFGDGKCTVGSRRYLVLFSGS